MRVSERPYTGPLARRSPPAPCPIPHRPLSPAPHPPPHHPTRLVATSPRYRQLYRAAYGTSTRPWAWFIFHMAVHVVWVAWMALGIRPNIGGWSAGLFTTIVEFRRGGGEAGGMTILPGRPWPEYGRVQSDSRAWPLVLPFQAWYAASEAFVPVPLRGSQFRSRSPRGVRQASGSYECRSPTRRPTTCALPTQPTYSPPPLSSRWRHRLRRAESAHHGIVLHRGDLGCGAHRPRGYGEEEGLVDRRHGPSRDCWLGRPPGTLLAGRHPRSVSERQGRNARRGD